MKVNLKKFIEVCLDNYQDYSLNFIDTKMRFIIQEQNNPLKYDFDEFPFLTYYSLQSKPNRDDIIKKINNNNINYLILNKFFNSSPKSSVKTRELQKFSLYNLGKYFVNSMNGRLVLNINENYSCLRMIFFIWNILEKKLVENGKGFIEIYFNLIIKYLPYILKNVQLKL